MDEKVRGIVLRTVKYGESSIIIDMFTDKYGKKSFIANLPRSRRSSMRPALWQPLSLVEFSADIRPNQRLPRPKDASLYYKYRDMIFNPVKSMLAMFTSEFLTAALKGEEENIPLHAYIENSLLWLDSCTGNYANFHIVFLMRLCRFVGIYPNLDDFSPTSYFDLRSGCYSKAQPPHPHFLSPAEAMFLPRLFRMNYRTMYLFRFSRQQRRHILDTLNTYYRIHLPGFPELKSIEVLSEVFD